VGWKAEAGWSVARHLHPRPKEKDNEEGLRTDVNAGITLIMFVTVIAFANGVL
jgi:hypothetical protein